ncbi:unnamed protein product [Camellia sinensis]
MEKKSDLHLPCRRIKIGEVVVGNFLENFCSVLEPMLRRVVSEEMEHGLRSGGRFLTRSPSLRIQALEPSALKLIFNKSLLLPIFTGSKIVNIENSPLQILLVDTTSDQLVPTGLSHPTKVEIVVLDGDFPPKDHNMWTSEEFDKKVKRERTGKRPLLAGDVLVTMRDGVAHVGEIEFTDNSSWTRGRKFRLGARVVQRSNQGAVRVREAMTEPFVVKDHRGELYRKHHPPNLEDEVWRLEKIGKNGAFHKKLASEAINTVQDFLKMSVVEPNKLRKILGVGMSDKMWEITIKHATTCIMGNKLYISRGADYTITLNPICQVFKAVINGQTLLPTTRNLTTMNRAYLENLVRDAYQNWNSLEEVDGLLNETTATLLLTQGEEVASVPSNAHMAEEYFNNDWPLLNSTPLFSTPFDSSSGVRYYNVSDSSSDVNWGKVIRGMMWAIARQRVASGGSFAWDRPLGGLDLHLWHQRCGILLLQPLPMRFGEKRKEMVRMRFLITCLDNEASNDEKGREIMRKISLQTEVLCRLRVADQITPGVHVPFIVLVVKFIAIEALSRSFEQLDPFSLVESELYILASRLRSMVVAEVPKLASAAEYFFKMGVEGKRFRPTVLLLMATALNVPIPGPDSDELVDAISTELRNRQQRIAEITEMIHDTRRGIGSLNFVMGNKLAVLAGDFLLSRACVALASLKNTEVVSLLATVVEHLVTGETMQMTTTSEQRCSMEYYLQKTYYKTASLISNSCKAIALLAGQTAEVSMLAYEYGKNLVCNILGIVGLAYQLIDDVLDFTGTSTSLGKGSLSDIRHGIVTAPILYAMEEFPQLRAVVDRGFDNPADVDLALDYLGRSRGIQRTKELAAKHANLASAAIDSLPENDDEDVQRSRRALVDLTHRVVTRTK